MTRRDEVHAFVASMSPQQPDPGTLQEDDRLIEDLGFDSLRLIELTVVLERAFTIGPFLPEQLRDVRTVNAVVELVETHHAADGTGGDPS